MNEIIHYYVKSNKLLYDECSFFNTYGKLPNAFTTWFPLWPNIYYCKFCIPRIGDSKKSSLKRNNISLDFGRGLHIFGIVFHMFKKYNAKLKNNVYSLLICFTSLHFLNRSLFHHQTSFFSVYFL